MILNKEQCEKSLRVLKKQYKYLKTNMGANYPYTIELLTNVYRCFEQLIKEHFELVELLKKHELQGLSIKELDAWFDRSLWHVNKVNELSNQLVELSRDVKSKDEYITELRNYITQIEREFKDDPPLKFEELREGMWVWDNKTKEYIVCSPNINVMGQRCVCYWCGYTFLDGEFDEDYIIFEENRFFRKEVKE